MSSPSHYILSHYTNNVPKNQIRLSGESLA